MKKSNDVSKLSLKRTKIARLNNIQMGQIDGGNQANVSTEHITRSSLECLTFVGAITTAVTTNTTGVITTVTNTITTSATIPTTNGG